MEVVIPVNDLSQLNTAFQDARIVGRRGGLTELEILLYDGVTQMPNLEKYYKISDCELPLPGHNADPKFDEQMRQLAGTSGASLEGVQNLFDALYSQTQRSVSFNAFYLRNSDAGISVEATAKSIISDPEVEAEELWRRELDAATMWARRRRGECTSSAVLGSGALAAVGVRSRLVLFVPLSSASPDLRRGLWDPRLLPVGKRPATGCSSHTAIEMLIDGQWLLGDEQRIRFSPTELGLGPLIQIRVAESVSSLVEPEIWGSACAGLGRLEGTPNPYRILSISDGWGQHANTVVSAGLQSPPTSIEIVDIFPLLSPKRPLFVPLDAVEDAGRYFLARANTQGVAPSNVSYFYRCANRLIPPFRLVRGYWNDEYFLLERVDDFGFGSETAPSRAADCFWVLRDSDFLN